MVCRWHKVCPPLFFQLYTVHAQNNGRILPCIFGLLPNKFQAPSTEFFVQVRNLAILHGDGPNAILFDFERAAINAASEEFPQADMKGCFFHLSSNLWKHIQRFGLQGRYQNDDVFALHLRMLAALAFIPPSTVIEAFGELVDVIRFIDQFIDYFEDTYIGRFRRNAPRRQPMFSMELWNIFHRTQDELPRTNNNIEGWHRRFQSNASAPHPVIWKFLDILKKEQGLTRVEALQTIGGHPPPAQRRRYKDCNQRTIAIVDDYPNRNTIQYLRSIAYYLSY